MTKVNQKAIEHLSKDRILYKIIKSHTLTKRTVKEDVYISLLGSIISQQLSTKAASTIYSRFIGLFEDNYPHPELLIRYDVEKLRKVGLSNQKSGYVKNIAEFFINKNTSIKYWNKKTDEEIIKELISIKGVGEWTVQMMLMFTLKREDVLPLNDLIIRNSIVRYYSINETGKELLMRIEKITAKWRPYRSIACYYLWAAKDNLK
jgi:DNA-3-methyladenine glycosylase II